MTVSSQTSRIEQLGDGTTTAFAVNFYFLENSDLKVFVNGVPQTITTNYTVTGAGNPAGGTVTFVTAPANGVQVVIFRDPALTQGLDYIDNDPFPAESHERGLDKLTMIAQRVKDLVSRALRLGDSVVGVNTELPALSGGQLLGTNPGGTGFQLYPLGSEPDTAANIVYTPAGTGAVATTVEEKLQTWISVKDFGAKGDGVTDDTAAIQAAINYGKTQKVLNNPTLGGVTVYFPRGTYIVSSAINMNTVYGFYLQGEGSGNTNIVFTAVSGNLFEYSVYIRCGISDMTLSSGTVTGGITLVPGGRTANCVNFRSTGGGVAFSFYRVVFQYFNAVLRTRDSTVNGDTHVHYQCSFFNNNIVWDNTNTQAVIWAFYSCQTFNNNICFNNPGLGLVVVGGDFINPGDFLVGSIAGTATQSLFKGVRFENFQNIDPASTPRLLVLSGSTGDITFENCFASGGGTLTGKTSSVISGLFNVFIKNCIFSGNWLVDVNSSANGVSSKLTFEECTSFPTVVQTVQPAQGNIPINLNFINCKSPTSNTAFFTKRFLGASYGQTESLPGVTNIDSIKLDPIINNSSSGKNVTLYLPSPYQLAFVGAELIFRPSIAVAVTINIWDSSAKTTLLGTVNAAASVTNQILEINPATAVFLTSTTNIPYVEITSVNNAGRCTLTAHLKFRQI